MQFPGIVARSHICSDATWTFSIFAFQQARFLVSTGTDIDEEDEVVEDGEDIVGDV